MKNKKIVFVVGPTASGKSDLAFALADKFGSAIVNCDSLQVYKKLDIGTAKPTEKELKGYDSYLFDCVNIDEDFTAGIFRRKALEILETTDHKSYVFVGGSGFYIKALLKGMFEEVPLKQEAQLQVQNLKETLSKEELFAKLQSLDPEYATKIHQNDQYRVGRALELILSLGKSMAQIQQEFAKTATSFPYPYKVYGLQVDKPILRTRVEERLSKMLHNGFKEEVLNLLKYRECKALSSVGYKEMLSLIDGQITEGEFKEEVIKNTLRLAKRQMTWFRGQDEVEWFTYENLDLIVAQCQVFLNEA